MKRYWKTFNPVKSLIFGLLASYTLFIVGTNIKAPTVLYTFTSVFLMFLGLHALNWLLDLDLMIPDMKRRLVAKHKLAWMVLVPLSASFLIIANNFSIAPFFVFLSNIFAVVLYGHLKQKYPIISFAKAYLASSAILFGTAVAGINRLFIVPTILIFGYVFVNGLLKNMAFGKATKHKKLTFLNMYNYHTVGIITASVLFALIAIGFIPTIYYSPTYLRFIGISDIFLSYVAYRMLVEPRKYASECRWFLLAGALFAMIGFLAAAYF